MVFRIFTLKVNRMILARLINLLSFRKGFVYEKEGAIWFKSSELGDDKDRFKEVMVNLCPLMLPTT